MNILIDSILQNKIEVIGAIIGLLYLYFEYKANIKMWPTGIAMALFYTYVFIEAKFYAFACINVYYIIVGIYGWWCWHKNKGNLANEAPEIVRTPTRLYLPILIVNVIIFGIVAFVLARFTDSPVVYGDSFVTTLSIVAMWMLAQRYAEQWILLIAVNIVSIGLYFWQDLYPTSIMYAVYAVVSVFGYIKWRKMAVNSRNG